MYSRGLCCDTEYGEIQPSIWVCRRWGMIVVQDHLTSWLVWQVDEVYTKCHIVRSKEIVMLAYIDRLYLSLFIALFMLYDRSANADKSIVLAIASSTSTYPQTGVRAQVGPDNLNVPRAGHIATLLSDGSVLVVGGHNATIPASSERYDPTTGAWHNSGTLSTDRSGYKAIVLSDGSVLVVGDDHDTLAERYDPISEAWRAAGHMQTRHFDPAVIRISDGKVLVIGGDIDWNYQLTASTVERYDPATDAWSAVSQLPVAVKQPTATLLADGTVLVVGTIDQSCGQWCNNEVAFASRYNPLTNSWNVTAAMSTTPGAHSASLLTNGKVLVIAEWGNNTQLYNPATNIWSSAMSLIEHRTSYTVTSLPNGRVLVLGGLNVTTGALLSTVEIYYAGSDTWIRARNLIRPRANHTATLLPNGAVLVVGGLDKLPDGTPFSTTSAELYNVAEALDQVFLPLFQASNR
jgi:large repetitive protein